MNIQEQHILDEMMDKFDKQKFEEVVIESKNVSTDRQIGFLIHLFRRFVKEVVVPEVMEMSKMIKEGV